MKRISHIFILLIFLSLSGCMTKIYLGKEKEPEKVLSDDMVMSSRAINPTTVPAGGTWGTVRGVINTNFTNINGTLDSVEVMLAEYGDSITNYYSDIQLRLLKSDTASMLANYTRNGELNTALTAKVSVSDTAAMLANYALTSELGEAGIGIADVRDEIADSLNALRPLYVAVSDTAGMLDTYAKLSDLSEGGISIGAVQDEIADSLNVLRTNIVVGDGTKGPFFDGSQDGGQMLYFYGDNGFYTALQGGAPTANRSYRLPIAELPGAGLTSLMNIDQYGNMGFISSTTYAPLSHSQAQTTITALPDSLLARYTKDQMDLILSNLPSGSFDTTNIYYVLDSLRTVLADSVNIETLLQVDLSTDTLSTKSYARSVGALLSGAVSLADSTGTSEGSYVTGYDFITAMQNQVHRADSTGNAPGNYVTRKALVDSIAANAGSVAGITLNSGTLTLTGDLATADDVTFFTNGNGQYDLPAGGGNLTIQSQVQAWIADSLNVLRTADSDTIPLFIFGLGSGHSSDTAVFNNGRLAGAFYNSGSDTLYVTELRGVLVEGTGTETIAVQVSWDVNMKDATPTNLNTTALTITSMTTGTADTTFDNNGIPPGMWIWCTLSGASANNKPTMLTLTMTGYRRNRSY